MVILTLTIPLFVMAAFNGLVRRYLRKYGSSRESSYLYHKARGTIIPLTIAPRTVYLAITISISPLLVSVASRGAIGHVRLHHCLKLQKIPLGAAMQWTQEHLPIIHSNADKLLV